MRSWNDVRADVMGERTATIVDVLPQAKKVARKAHYLYGLDEEDIYGTFAVELVERASDYLILHNDGRQGIIENRLLGIAAREARNEQVRRLTDDDQYFYDPEYVRLFLPFFFSYEDWEQAALDSEGPASSHWKTGDAVATALDMKRAWKRLKGWQETVIVARHVGVPPASDGSVDWEAIAEKTGRKHGNSAQVAYLKATTELVVEMNQSRALRVGDYAGAGSRKAISNAHANAIISDSNN